MLRVAIIGVSGYGSILTDLLRDYSENGRILFTDATVINEKEEEKRCAQLRKENVRIFKNHREMLAGTKGGIDLCVVPVGIPWHAPIAVDALEAGCHVFLEKPIAGSYIEAARICSAAQDAQRHLLIDFQDLSDPGVWQIKDALLAGAIGDLLEIRAVGAWPRPLEYFLRNKWAGKLFHEGVAVSDSPHNNALAHLVNLALFWAGQSRSTSARPKSVEGLLYRFQPIESHDTGWIQWTLENGIRVVCAVSHSSEKIVPPQVLFHGTGGDLLWDYENGLLENTQDIPRLLRPAMERRRELALESAFAFLNEQPALYCTPDNALAHAMAVDLAQQSLPIQSNLNTMIQLKTGEEGTYQFVPGIDSWCRSALKPGIPPQPLETHSGKQKERRLVAAA